VVDFYHSSLMDEEISAANRERNIEYISFDMQSESQ
jgi:hypothetical protein